MKKALIITSLCVCTMVMYGCDTTKPVEVWMWKSMEEMRDVSRGWSLKIIETSLDLHLVDNTELPIPDGAKKVYDENGDLLIYQGLFGQEVADQLDTLYTAPQDPFTDSYFEYALLANKQTYQVRAINESWDEEFEYIGMYNGYFIMASEDKYYLRVMPNLFLDLDDEQVQKIDITDLLRTNKKENVEKLAEQIWVDTYDLQEFINGYIEHIKLEKGLENMEN